MNNHEHSGHWLDDELSRLLPDVFLHPVWVHFARAGKQSAPDVRQALECAAEEMLAQGNYHNACRVLLVCAAQQLWWGDAVAAWQCAHQALALADSHRLFPIAWWAAWGASAICIRQGNPQQAAEYLKYLHSVLSQQNEWALADIVDAICLAVLNPSGQSALMPGKTCDFSSFGDVALAPIWDQLLHWGDVVSSSRPATYDGIVSVNQLNSADQPLIAPPLSLHQRWQSLWLNLRRAMRGELRLKWVESRPQLPSPVGEDTIVSRFLPPPVHIPVPDPPPPEPAIANHQDITSRPVTCATLTVYVLGAFHLAVNDIPTNHLISGKSKMILAYLLMHHDQPVPREVLMDVFWPDAEPESARNRLNVVLHHARQAVRTITDKPVVVFEDGAYGISPEFDLWIDADEFDRHVQKGRQLDHADKLEAAVKEYELARDVYQGEFMADEPYEDWPVLIRESLRVDYLDILDRLSQIYFDSEEYAACTALCQQIVFNDNCREDAYCRMMRCYSRQGQHHLALRQYQACLKALRTEMDVDPTPTTVQLYERIRRREAV